MAIFNIFREVRYNGNIRVREESSRRQTDTQLNIKQKGARTSNMVVRVR